MRLRFAVKVMGAGGPQKTRCKLLPNASEFITKNLCSKTEQRFLVMAFEDAKAI
jgi:hypothetical protein